MVWSVTFFLAMAGGKPIGECEEYRSWTADGALWWFERVVGNDEAIHDCEDNGDGEDKPVKPCVFVVEDIIDLVVA
jgi:hypothetical protein